jgi:predicted small lipoprotein YifL
MRKKIFTLFLLVLVFFSCGKKGPLVLEPENTPPAVENFQIRQIGGQIELSWKFPDLPGDKMEPFEIARVAKVYVYHAILQSAETPTNDIFMKKAELLAKLKGSEIKGRGQNTYSCRFSFKNKELQEKNHGFALNYFYGRKKSVPGPLQTLETLITPPPVQDLIISRQGKIVFLNWGKPVVQDKDQSIMPISGYHIYRRISSIDNERDFRLISSEPVLNEFFYDLDTGTDGEYEYQISSRLGKRVESAPSNVVKIKIQDTFPPDIPGNLVIFTAKDQIFLTWETVPDTDLAFYRVYRKFSDKEDFKLLADKVTDNFFRDKQIARGKLYIYAISAVDKKGNESELSLSGQQLFE